MNYQKTGLAIGVIGVIIAGVYVYQTTLTSEQRTVPDPVDRVVDKENNIPVMMEDTTDITVCGDVPRVSGDGGPTSRYAVCRNKDTGDCYYKTSYMKQIDGCDPAFSDENPYGNDECFTSVEDVYQFSGALLEKEKQQYRSEDTCVLTEQQYVESKIKK